MYANNIIILLLLIDAGIGDRHLENLLVDLTTGAVIPIAAHQAVTNDTSRTLLQFATVGGVTHVTPDETAPYPASDKTAASGGV